MSNKVYKKPKKEKKDISKLFFLKKCMAYIGQIFQDSSDTPPQNN